MCGIAGIYQFAGDMPELAARLQIMSDAMLHRGPDQGGMHTEPTLRSGLAVRRLSIVDPEHGSQPLFSEDGSIAVVCNGEIYNHRALRSELESKGYRLRSHTDAEVLAHLYQEEGVGFLKRLNGMFAVAVLDRNKRSLLLARDPVGMKHLYWTQSSKGFAFASEVRPLIAAGLATATPDWTSLNSYFSTGWIQSPRSAFEGVQKLEPGSYLQLDGTGLSHGRYWSPKFSHPEPGLSLQDYSEELRRLLEQAVATHLDADVPAGLYLSGGWDSSLVSLYASRISSKPLNSYSLHFPNDPTIDESPYFRAVVDQIGTQSHEIELRDTDIRDALNSTARSLEEPVVTSPTMLGHLLAKTAGSDLKVVLGGEGADEIFGGYPRFENSPLHRVRHATPASLIPRSVPLPLTMKWARAFRYLSAGNEELAHQELISQQNPREYRHLFSDGIPFSWSTRPGMLGITAETRASMRDLLDLQLSVEFSGRLADGILFAMDKNSMAHSLEVRMPFLDKNIVEFAHRLPSKYKVQGREMKRVLAPLARELPDAVANRRKLGLQVPQRVYQTSLMREFYVETILETSLAAGIFDHRRLEPWVRKRAKGSGRRAMELWPLCHFCLWWKQLILNGEGS